VWTAVTTGNIVAASTSAIGKAMAMTYDLPRHGYILSRNYFLKITAGNGQGTDAMKSISRTLSCRSLFFFIVLVGIGIRGFYWDPSHSIRTDSIERYVPMAKNLLAGRGFSVATTPPFRPDTFNPPGYPLYLAGLLKVFGGSIRSVVVSQVLLELLTLLVLYRIAIALNVRAPVVMTLAWVCPFLPRWSELILTEALATFCATAFVYALVTRRWMLGGLTAGFSLLVRPDMLPAVILCTFVAVMLSEKRVPVLLWITATMVLVLVPWSLRTFMVSGSPSPLGGIAAQAKQPYVLWLDTWADDPAYEEPFWWDGGDFSNTGNSARFEPRAFPEFLPPEERSQAVVAMEIASKQRSMEGKPNGIYARLSQVERHDHPFRVYISAPIKRVVSTWMLERWGTPAQSLLCVCWIITLALAIRGMCVGGSRTAIPLAMIAGRTVIPALSLLGCEPRYMNEALPCVFLFVAIAIMRILDGSSNGLRVNVRLHPHCKSCMRSPFVGNDILTLSRRYPS
jgi:hypothetical protein